MTRHGAVKLHDCTASTSRTHGPAPQVEHKSRQDSELSVAHMSG